MRSQKFHSKSEKPVPIVVDEASRLTINGTEQVNVYQLDDTSKKCGLLATGQNLKVKLNNVNEVLLESKGDFESVIEAPDKIDNTPIEVTVERPMTQTQQIKMWLQNEENIKVSARTQLKWEDFKDLGDLDDSEEFYERFGHEDMTKYEMQAEMMRQEANPLRGNPISDNIQESKNARTNDDDARGTSNQLSPQEAAQQTPEVQGTNKAGD